MNGDIKKGCRTIRYINMVGLHYLKFISSLKFIYDPKLNSVAQVVILADILTLPTYTAEIKPEWKEHFEVILLYQCTYYHSYCNLFCRWNIIFLRKKRKEMILTHVQVHKIEKKWQKTEEKREKENWHETRDYDIAVFQKAILKWNKEDRVQN